MAIFLSVSCCTLLSYFSSPLITFLSHRYPFFSPGFPPTFRLVSSVIFLLSPFLFSLCPLLSFLSFRLFLLSFHVFLSPFISYSLLSYFSSLLSYVSSLVFVAIPFWHVDKRCTYIYLIQPQSPRLRC